MRETAEGEKKMENEKTYAGYVCAKCGGSMFYTGFLDTKCEVCGEKHEHGRWPY